MNIPDLSQSSFHDAHQDSSPVTSGLNATPASAATVSTVEDIPIGQCCIFAEASNRESDNDDEELEDTCQRNGTWLLGRIQNQSLDIDMALVKIEAEEDSDSDSNCSAAKAGELFSSVLEPASDQREIVVLEDDDDILCDTPHNMIKVKRGLAPEVKVSAPPADWVPDRVKLECAEPASFLVIDNPGGWGQYTFCPKFHNKAKGKDIKKGQYCHHVLPTGARPVPAEGKGKREKAGWNLHYTGWSNPENSNLRSGASYKDPFLDC
jgi:hypothetical protein